MSEGEGVAENVVLPISDRPFMQVVKGISALERERAGAGIGRQQAIDLELKDLFGRRNKLLGNLETEGALEQIDERLQLLGGMLAEGSLTHRDLLDENTRALGFDEDDELAGEYAGARGWYCRQGLELLREELKKASAQGRGPQVSSQSDPPTVFPPEFLETARSMADSAIQIREAIRDQEREGGGRREAQEQRPYRQRRPEGGLRPEQRREGGRRDGFTRRPPLGGGEQGFPPPEEVDYVLFVRHEEEMHPSVYEPSYMSWYRSLSEQRQVEVDTRQRVARAAEHKMRQGDASLEQTFQNPHLFLSREQFDAIYNMPGGRTALETIFGDLFEGHVAFPYSKKKSFRLVLKKGAVEKLGAIPTRDPTTGDEVYFEKYRKDLTQKVAAISGLSGVDSRAAVAAAWNMCYVLNVFESTDIKRQLKPNSQVFTEQQRALSHPVIKAINKIIKKTIDELGTEEGWGGPVGVWLVEKQGRTSLGRWLRRVVPFGLLKNKYVRRFEKGEWLVFPETMMISLFEMDVVDSGRGQKETLGEMILAKREIDWKRLPTNLTGVQADYWDSAIKIYLALMGKNLIDTSSKEKISKWVAELVGAMHKLQGTVLRNEYSDPWLLFGILAASIGLKEGYSRPVLAMPGGFTDYTDFLNTVLTASFDAKDRRWLKRQYLAGPGGGLFRAYYGLRSLLKI